MNKRQRSFNARRAAFIRWLRAAAERERNMSPMVRIYARKLCIKFFAETAWGKGSNALNEGYRWRVHRVRIRTVPTISTGQ